jgi:hypothetical protein
MQSNKKLEISNKTNKKKYITKEKCDEEEEPGRDGRTVDVSELRGVEALGGGEARDPVLRVHDLEIPLPPLGSRLLNRPLPLSGPPPLLS